MSEHDYSELRRLADKASAYVWPTADDWDNVDCVVNEERDYIVAARPALTISMLDTIDSLQTTLEMERNTYKAAVKHFAEACEIHAQQLREAEARAVYYGWIESTFNGMKTSEAERFLGALGISLEYDKPLSALIDQALPTPAQPAEGV